jgi:hypothetical protein
LYGADKCTHHIEELGECGKLEAAKVTEPMLYYEKVQIILKIGIERG